MVSILALESVCLDIDPSTEFVKISMNASTTMKIVATTMPHVSILWAVIHVNVIKVTKAMDYGVFLLVSVVRMGITVLRMPTVLRGPVINGNVFALMDMKVMDIHVKT